MRIFFGVATILILSGLIFPNLISAQSETELPAEWNPPPLPDGASTETQNVEFASSPNPVGSGARAIGMGGAFIGVANDGTAASWNPGGLIQLRISEISVVGNWFHRIEDNTFEDNPEANGSETVSMEDLNYFSATYPFRMFGHAMVVSLNYQHLYEFNRDWKLPWNESSTETDGLGNIIGSSTTVSEIDYRQTGTLSALGLAYCVQPESWNASLGFTLNFWDEDLFNNQWDERYYMTTKGTIHLDSSPDDIIDVYEYIRTDSYSFSGFNANLGFLWDVWKKEEKRLTIGGVVKLPFTADLKHEWTEKETGVNNDEPASRSEDEKLDMPMSYGIGIFYKASDQLFLAADFYRTEWDDFILTDWDDNEKSPITNKHPDESDISPTHQVRLGGEYTFYKDIKEMQYAFSLRGGAFYDPAPASGSPDDWYGFTLGGGIDKRDLFAFDVAYQYRFGNDVRTVVAPEGKLSQDVDEHIIFASFIFRFAGKKTLE